jgi:ribose 5-phosphate isomerase B
MNIFLAADHAGFYLKEKIKNHLEKRGHSVTDFGAFSYSAFDDYPDFIGACAREVAKDPDKNKGIILGGSGEAEAMVANKYKGIRCGLFYAKAVPVGAADVMGRVSSDPFEIIRLSREHNNANMLSLSSRFLTEEDALAAVDLWLSIDFPGDDRHVRRINQFKKLGA